MSRLILIVLLLYGVDSRRIKRVIGGMEVPCGTQMRVVSLRNATNNQHLCGATLLSPHFGLTAAHCVHFNPNNYSISLNNYCIYEQNEIPPKVEVLEIITHPSYNKSTRAHDIGLLRIKLDLNTTNWLNDTLLPKSSFGISGDCTIYGYGVTDVYTNEISDKLLAAKLNLISLDECTHSLGPHVAPEYDSGMICAVGTGVDACQGDSGGPLICKGLLEGICSHGLSCGVPGLPGMYVSTGSHLKWIRDVMKYRKYKVLFM